MTAILLALGVQVGALPTTLAGAVRGRGLRLGLDDPALLWPVGLLTVLIPVRRRLTQVVSAAQAAA